MAAPPALWGPLAHVSRALGQRAFRTTGCLSAIQKLTQVLVVDNSALGNTPYHRPPQCIHVYNMNRVSKVGNRIFLAIKGQKKALTMGHYMPKPPMTSRFNSSNMVLIKDNGNPVGTRIKVPGPTSLSQKEGEYSKLLGIAQNFM